MCRRASLNLANGEEARLVASVFDMQVAQYGIDRGLAANVAKDYNDNAAYTPAWAGKITGVLRDQSSPGAQFAYNAAKTHGKSMVIMGAAINHWYHNDMMYRGVMNLLHICGCVGQIGGGWAHYVGQEKLRPQAGWAPLAFATRLAASAAPDELHLLLVLPHRPVALREAGMEEISLAAGRQGAIRRR